MLQHMLSSCRPPFFYFHNAYEGHLASALHHTQSSVPYSEQLHILPLAGQKKGKEKACTAVCCCCCIGWTGFDVCWATCPCIPCPFAGCSWHPGQWCCKFICCWTECWTEFFCHWFYVSLVTRHSGGGEGGLLGGPLCASLIHRHGGISLSAAPWWGLGTVSSLVGCETRPPKVGTQSCRRDKDDAQDVGPMFGACQDPAQPNPYLIPSPCLIYIVLIGAPLLMPDGKVRWGQWKPSSTQTRHPSPEGVKWQEGLGAVGNGVHPLGPAPWRCHLVQGCGAPVAPVYFGSVPPLVSVQEVRRMLGRDVRLAVLDCMRVVYRIYPGQEVPSNLPHM